MRALDGQVTLEKREQDSVPDGPERVQVEAPFPSRRLPLSDPHRCPWRTLSTARVSFDYVAGAGERERLSSYRLEFRQFNLDSPGTGIGEDTRVEAGVETGTRRLRDGAVGRVQQGTVLLLIVVVDERPGE